MGLLGMGTGQATTLLGRGIGAAVGGDMPRRAYYGMQRSIGNASERGRAISKRDQIKSAMSDLMKMPPEAQKDQKTYMAYIQQVDQKYDLIEGDELMQMAKAIVTGNKFFADQEWTGEVRKQTRAGWDQRDTTFKAGQEEREYLTETVRPNAAADRKQSLLDLAAKRKQTGIMDPLRAQQAEQNVALTKKRIEVAGIPKAPSASELTSQDKRAKRKNDRSVLSAGIPGVTVDKAKNIVVSEEAKPQVEAALEKLGLKPIYVPMTDEYGEESSIIYGYDKVDPAEKAAEGTAAQDWRAFDDSEGSTETQAASPGAPAQRADRDDSLRPDGTKKGNGWLGVIKRPDGNVMTEFSVGVNINGEEMDIPSLVPGLTKDEIEILKKMSPGDKMPDSIVAKAAAHAKKQIAQGKSPFKEVSNAPERGSFTKAPSEEQKDAAMKEVIDLANKLGVGPGNWKALWTMMEKLGVGIWTEYAEFVEDAKNWLVTSQKESQQRLKDMNK